MAARIISYYTADDNDVETNLNDGKFGSGTVVRNYHAVRNEVHDKASGLKMPYKDVVLNDNLGPMIEARKQVISGE